MVKPAPTVQVSAEEDDMVRLVVEKVRRLAVEKDSTEITAERATKAQHVIVRGEVAVSKVFLARKTRFIIFRSNNYFSQVQGASLRQLLLQFNSNCINDVTTGQ